jgi:nicotinamidase-related amidase
MEQNNQNKALLVMDMQEGILGNFPGAEALIARVAKAIDHARSKQIPVIYVVVGFRKGAPEVSLNNKSFGAGKERFAGMDMDAFMKVHPALEPQDDEVVVTKRRVSAFTGSDLAVILSAYSTKHLVLTGIATGGVVLSTLIEAADKDYQMTVIEDCCADGDEEVHRVLTTKIFSKRAEIVNLEDWSKM